MELLVWDALRVGEVGRTFDSALDVGMFHTLTDEERPVYEDALRGALQPAGARSSCAGASGTRGATVPGE